MEKVNLNSKLLAELEDEVLHEFQNFYGLGRYGFCDFSQDVIDLLLEFLYRRNIWKLNDQGDYQNIDHAIREMGYCHFNSAVHNLRSTYLLVSRGHYTEAAILIRANIESFVRVKYLRKIGDVKLVKLALAGHQGIKGERFRVSYETQFNGVAPGLYPYYRLMCDFAHGAYVSEMLKWDLDEVGKPNLLGVEFREKQSSMMVNQICFYSLGQLNLAKAMYPEAYDGFTDELKSIFSKTVDVHETAVKQFKESKTGKSEWADSVNHLLYA